MSIDVWLQDRIFFIYFNWFVLLFILIVLRLDRAYTHFLVFDSVRVIAVVGSFFTLSTFGWKLLFRKMHLVDNFSYASFNITQMFCSV